MRILQVIHDFLPDHCAGSEIYTYHLSQALRRRGHGVSLLFTEKRLDRPQFEVREGEYEGLPFHEVVYNRHFHDIRDLYDDARMEAPIGQVLDQVQPDVVHVQSLVYLGLGLLRQVAARGLPALMTLHEYYLTCARGGLRLDLDGRLCAPIDFGQCARCLAPYPIERERYADAPDTAHGQHGELRYFARAADERLARMLRGVDSVARFIAPSRFLRDRLVEDGLPADKVEVSDYGFPPVERVPPVPRAPGAPLRLGYLGTLSDYKGVHLAVEAFSRLPAGRATLRIHGDPTWFPDYVGPLMARAETLPGLTFEGVLETGRAPWFLAELDALIVPSQWYENSPLTIHEAFQCAVPVVATDLGGMRELLASGGGLLFRRGDAEDLARALRRLLDEPGLAAGLRATIPAVKSIDDDAAQVEATLQRLL